jgi:hypothetical protein
VEGGVATTRKGVVHYMGYDKPTTCGLRVPGAHTVQAHCADPSIHLVHEDQV